VFSSEVDTGSREENALKQKLELGSDDVGAEKALAVVVGTTSRAALMANRSLSSHIEEGIDPRKTSSED
jgi:hypothetical protein